MFGPQPQRTFGVSSPGLDRHEAAAGATHPALTIKANAALAMTNSCVVDVLRNEHKKGANGPWYSVILVLADESRIGRWGTSG